MVICGERTFGPVQVVFVVVYVVGSFFVCLFVRLFGSFRTTNCQNSGS